MELMLYGFRCLLQSKLKKGSGFSFTAPSPSTATASTCHPGYHKFSEKSCISTFHIYIYILLKGARKVCVDLQLWLLLFFLLMYFDDSYNRVGAMILIIYDISLKIVYCR